MPDERPRADLSHIAFEREPDVETERRRRNPPPPPPRVAGRSQHGRRLASDVSAVADEVSGARQRAGIDPARLLVLEFATWSADARDVFETRLNAVVVDESAEPRQLTRVIAVPPANETADNVAERIEAAGTGRGDAPTPAETLRLRRANQSDVDRARREGVAIPDRLVATPRNLVVVDAVAWSDEAEAALRELGVVPVGTMQDSTETTRVLVQFPTVEDVRTFEREAQHYVRQESRTTALPPGLRRSFFDGLDWVRSREREDRLGARLRRDGFPEAERFAIDVDLWHPGADTDARAVLDQLRRVCGRYGGRVVDDLRTSSLVLARIEATRRVAEVLLGLDIVANVNLPPALPAAYGGLFSEVDPLPDHLEPDGTEPVVGVVDSGVLAGHPLLRGWVLEERDFDSGESTVVDRHGHGTQVAGLVVYGDVARCIETGDWTPRAMVASAKVLRRDPVDESRPVFPENHRPEKLVEEAIRYYHRERGCRIFNLSVGNPDDVYMIRSRRASWNRSRFMATCGHS